MAGTPDPTAPHHWAQPYTPEPHREVIDRLRLGYRVWRTLQSAEGRHTALAWMVGANPRLGNRTPVSAVRDLKDTEVIGAALAFIDGAQA